MDNQNDTKNKHGDSSPAVLCTVEDVNEAAIVMALLESCGIPSMKKYKGIGDSIALYMGRSGGNVEILVPPGLIEAAREALSSESAIEADPDGADENGAGRNENEDEYKNESRRRRTAGWLLALVFILPVAAAIVAMIIRLVFRM